ncbi:type VI secretion system baseplate subunit TssG [Ideonella sp. DXS29W]|uniref:Type VI secretion system baseplate subunit TssG n=1 Tax=Ideonella lacteola TaxID=2984193 RepID=A0ABU9BVB3_9BURK
MRRLKSPLNELLGSPHRFGFHQAVRLLTRWMRRSPTGASKGTVGAATDVERAGTDAEDELAPASHNGQAVALRYRNNLSLSFPASEIAQLSVSRSGQGQVERIEITPAFMGLLGINGALPSYYTELFAHREEAPHRDPSARAFLDIFQHRAVSLFHDAWRKHRLALQYEQDGDKRFLPMALSIAGIGQGPLQRRLQAQRGGVADHTLAFYAGTLQQRHIGATQLQGMLSHYFGVPVQVTQFVGRWFTLGESSRTLLGMANATLGAAAVVGERVWQRDLRLRITMGPLSRADLQRFLPGAPGALALREWLTLLTGVSLEYEVRLQLKAQAVSTVQLGGGPDTVEACARLGWDTFIQTRPSPIDRSEAGYDIHAVPS